MFKLINLSYKYLPERKHELTREIKVEYSVMKRTLHYKMVICFSGEDKPEYREVDVKVKVVEGDNTIDNIREMDIVQSLCFCMAALFPNEHRIEHRTPQKVVSEFPLFRLNGRPFKELKRWNAKYPSESTWRLCRIESGELFFICGLGTMERKYSFGEGKNLKELPERVREYIKEEYAHVVTLRVDHLIDICSISREMRDSDLPF